MPKYKYNGYILPKLPESAYPYAFISASATTEGVFHLYFADKLGYIETNELSNSYTLGLTTEDVFDDSKAIYAEHFVIAQTAEAVASASDLYPGINMETWLEDPLTDFSDVLDVPSGAQFALPAGYGPHWSNTTLYDSEGDVFIEGSDPVSAFDLENWLTGLVLGLAGKPLPFAKTEGGSHPQPVAYLYNGVRLPPIPNEIADYPYLCVLQNGTSRYEVYGSHSRIYISPGLNLGFGISTWGYLESCEMSYATNSDFTSWSEGPFEEHSSLGLTDEYNVLWCNVDVEQEGTVICKASEPVAVYE